MTTRIAWVLAPWRTLSDLQADVAAIRLAVLGIPAKFRHLERLIMATAEELATRIDAATNEVADDLRDVKEALEAALANVDGATRAAVEAELAKLEAPIARLEELGADPADPVPPVEPSPVDEPGDPDVDQPV